MRPRKERGGKTRRPSSSPTRDRPLGFGPTPSGSHPSRFPSPATSLLDREFATEEDVTRLEDLGFPPEYYYKNGDSSNSNPRSFPHSVKQQCWDKAEKIKGRDPDRWRRDALGNTVFRKLVGCPGCLCHDYDHIIPFSKGGKSSLENCQVLQATVNRSKGNRMEISKADLIQKSAYCRVSVVP
ncbi:uncharacterized protein LOC131231171 isoform X2 [Magnolia sinica]|uniref:uncharacterized protein LOC131231171 isoform X2 n=1 Tax=Magnolia sinica TaxID=86752 RepID=UPI002659C76F|nr:uncharacterized protein LOC131231171 isoform X2 [Magnolia sinica]